MSVRALLFSSLCSALLCACSGTRFNPFAQRTGCINSKIYNAVCQHLCYASDLGSVDKADAFAKHWQETEFLLSLARETGLKFPADISRAYNSTLELAHRNRYYGSALLRSAMSKSRELSAAETFAEPAAAPQR